MNGTYEVEKTLRKRNLMIRATPQRYRSKLYERGLVKILYCPGKGVSYDPISLIFVTITCIFFPVNLLYGLHYIVCVSAFADLSLNHSPGTSFSINIK